MVVHHFVYIDGYGLFSYGNHFLVILAENRVSLLLSKDFISIFDLPLNDF